MRLSACGYLIPGRPILIVSKIAGNCSGLKEDMVPQADHIIQHQRGEKIKNSHRKSNSILLSQPPFKRHINQNEKNQAEGNQRRQIKVGIQKRFLI